MIFVKMAASEIAQAHGAIATFMPKPFSNRTGSGAHFHVSIGMRGPEECLLRQERQVAAWASSSWLSVPRRTARARARSDRVCAPTVNSYKRLVVGRSLSGATWAPAYIAYGDNNRTACVRVPLRTARSPAARFRLQSVSGLGRADRRRARWHRPQARSGSAAEHQPVRAVAGGAPATRHQAAAAVAERRPSMRSSGHGGLQQGLGTRAGARIHPLEAHGVDRIFAPCVRLGIASLSWNSSRRLAHVWNCRSVGQKTPRSRSGSARSWCRC